MRHASSFRPFRGFTAPVLVVVFALSTIGIVTPAMAKGGSAKTVTCSGPTAIAGTYGQPGWTLASCMPVAVVGPAYNQYQGIVSQPFPESPATIQWNPLGPGRNGPALSTTISFVVVPETGHHDKCGQGSSEYYLKGTVTANSGSTPVVKGNVKMFVCESAMGTLTALKNLQF